MAALAVFVDDFEKDLREVERLWEVNQLDREWTLKKHHVKREESVESIAASVQELLKASGGPEAVVFLDLVYHPRNPGRPSVDADGPAVARALRAGGFQGPLIAVSSYQSDMETFLLLAGAEEFDFFVPKELFLLLTENKMRQLVGDVSRRAKRRTGAREERPPSGGPGTPRGTADWLIVVAKNDEREAAEKVLGWKAGVARMEDGSDLTRWRYGALEIGLACLDRQGLVNAAVKTCALVAETQPKNLLMIGMCGGREGKAERYDVIVPARVTQYVAGKLQNGAVLARTGKEIELSLSAKDFARARKELGREVGAAIGAGRFPRRDFAVPAVREEPMASSDLLNEDPEVTESLLAPSQEDVVAVDMEAYAIGVVGREAGVPTYVVKGVSDKLGKREDSKESACLIAAVAGFALIEWLEANVPQESRPSAS